MNDDKDCENDLLSFAHTLDSFAATLSKGERIILAAILLNSMDPVERMNWRNITNLLRPDEIQILDKLQGEGAKQ
jgi:hypothetical protein